MRHIHFETIDSTNAYLKRESENLNDFTFVSTSFQEEGKGRDIRSWISNKDENILFSFLIKDIELISKYSCLSIYTAMEVAKFLESKGIQDVKIKWPNDIYVKDRKICGILLEGSVPNYIVVGIGLNVLQSSFPRDLRNPATSMALELNEPLSLKVCQEELINKLYSFWTTFNKNTTEYDAYLSSHNYLLKKRVKIKQDNLVITGRVVDINSKNELIIKDQNKSTFPVSSGEVEVLWVF